jgi:hypothetical protein
VAPPPADRLMANARRRIPVRDIRLGISGCLPLAGEGLWSRRLPRCRHDFTLPAGMPVACEIPRHVRPTTPARYAEAVFDLATVDWTKLEEAFEHGPPRTAAERMRSLPVGSAYRALTRLNRTRVDLVERFEKLASRGLQRRELEHAAFFQELPKSPRETHPPIYAQECDIGGVRSAVSGAQVRPGSSSNNLGSYRPVRRFQRRSVSRSWSALGSPHPWTPGCGPARPVGRNPDRDQVQQADSTNRDRAPPWQQQQIAAQRRFAEFAPVHSLSGQTRRPSARLPRLPNRSLGHQHRPTTTAM